MELMGTIGLLDLVKWQRSLNKKGTNLAFPWEKVLIRMDHGLFEWIVVVKLGLIIVD